MSDLQGPNMGEQWVDNILAKVRQKQVDNNNTKPTIEERTIDLLLQLSNSYFELLAQTSQQKRVISAQGALINQCMERIMSLEGRSILGDFNQRLEVLEANRGKMYEVSHTELSKMMEQLVKHVDELEGRTHELELYQVGPVPELDCIRQRLDALEIWLYTHDYAYFQEQEKPQEGRIEYEKL